MINDNIILCYSGTGNCLASAQQLSRQLNAPVVQITHEQALKKEKVECKACVLIYPAYAYGMPLTVKRLIENWDFSVEHLSVLVTCGTDTGGAMAEAVRLFKKRKQCVHFCAKIKAVENYVIIFGLAKPQRLAARTALQAQITDDVAAKIQQRQANKILLFRPLSSLISALFRTAKPLLVRLYRVTDNCNGCGVCSRVCPAAAISIGQAENKPTFNTKKCDHCQACLHLCPQKAIKFLKITPSSRRYRHNGVSVEELYKR